MTPFKILSVLQYQGKRHFGATVLALQPTKEKRKKLDEKWHYGIWVGNVVLTEDGVLLARTVRVVNDEEAKTLQYHLLVKDLPWDSKEATKKNEESPVERQDELVRMPKCIPATVVTQQCRRT